MAVRKTDAHKAPTHTQNSQSVARPAPTIGVNSSGYLSEVQHIHSPPTSPHSRAAGVKRSDQEGTINVFLETQKADKSISISLSFSWLQNY